MAILCCVCGISIEANALNMCTACISKEVDFFEGLDRHPELVQCRSCFRYQARAKSQHSSSLQGTWLACELESTELMAICLRSLSGIHKFKLMDAAFIWTEPHSKRLKVKLLLQREVIRHAVIQNVTIVTFVVETTKCPDCTKQYHNHTWRALVQLRQKTGPPRPLLRLEQVILAHGAEADAVGITTVKDGIDFYYETKSNAKRLVHFLAGHVPLRSKESQKLISENIQNATARLETSISVEICPIGKDDLVVLPPRTAQSCGAIARLVLCARTTAVLHVVDPLTGQRGEVSSEKYWKQPFLQVETSAAMIELMVLDVEPVEIKGRGRSARHPSIKRNGQTYQEMVLADVEVARMSDWGVNDQTFHVRSHLGALLQAGDTVLGYDLATANFGSSHASAWNDQDGPDLVLVRKVYPRKMMIKKTKEKEKKTSEEEQHEGRSTRQLQRLQAKRAATMSKAEAARQDDAFEAFAHEYLVEKEEEDEERQEKVCSKE